jgi:hypothetical protein
MMTKLLAVLVVVGVGLMGASHAYATHSPPGTKLWGYEASNFPSRILQYDLATDMFETSCVPPGSMNGRGMAFDPGGGFLWYTFVTPAGSFLGDGFVHKTSPPPACANLGQVQFGDGPGGVDQDDIGAIDLDPDNGNLWIAGYREWPLATNHQVLYEVAKTSGAILKACWVPDQGEIEEGNDTLAVTTTLAGQPPGKYLLTDGGTAHNTNLLYAAEASSATDYTTPAAVPPCTISAAYDPVVALSGIDLEETSPFDLIATDLQFIYDLDGPPFTTIQAVMSAAPTLTLEDVGLGTILAGPEPDTLTLAPSTDMNEVGTQHCVTATVRDEAGQPLSGVTVVFNVEGASELENPPDEDGMATTNIQGEATFCYTGPDLPGEDVIEAFADTNQNGQQDAPPPAGSEPFDAAAKVWALPETTPGCAITISDGGSITTATGSRGSFGGNAKAELNGTTSGEQHYRDHRMLLPVTFDSLEILAIVCIGDGSADIYGGGEVNGLGPQAFRIRVKDGGEPGAGGDTYQLIAGAYSSGPENNALTAGDVQIHRL